MKKIFDSLSLSLSLFLMFFLSACSDESKASHKNRTITSELGGGSIEAIIEQDERNRFPPPPRKNPTIFVQAPAPKAKPGQRHTQGNLRPPHIFNTDVKACYKNYITKSGEYGPIAKKLIDRFKHMKTGQRKPGEPSPEHYDRLFKKPSNNISQTCPAYNGMSVEDRMHFWLWTFTAIARIESDCGANAINLKDTNGVSGCDFQLPQKEIVKKEDGPRDPSWRGPGCDIHNAGRAPQRENTLAKVNGRFKHILTKTKFAMSNDDNCTACAVEIMGKNICGFHSGESAGRTCSDPPIEKIFGRQMFWNEMKAYRDGKPRKIIKLIEEYPGCRG